MSKEDFDSYSTTVLGFDQEDQILTYYITSDSLVFELRDTDKEVVTDD